MLTRQLEDICQIVHPKEKTFDTYGHSVRILLILACTEVETHWRGILVANDYIRSTYRTNDYVMLLDAMRLDEYSVSFPAFPWLEPIRPFSRWDPKKPTTSLKWYASYNAVKHNREGEFERATLRSAFEAVAACITMLIAQFGLHFEEWRSSDLRRFCSFDSLPKWSPSHVYAFPYERNWVDNYNDMFEQVKYPFISRTEKFDNPA